MSFTTSPTPKELKPPLGKGSFSPSSDHPSPLMFSPVIKKCDVKEGRETDEPFLSLLFFLCEPTIYVRRRRRRSRSLRSNLEIYVVL